MSKFLLTSLMVATCVPIVACLQGLNGEVFTTPPQNRVFSLQKTAVIESHITLDDTPSWKWRTKRMSGGEKLVYQQILNAANARVVGQEGTLYETADSGETWRRRKIGIPADSDVTSASFSSFSTGWVSAARTPSDVLDTQGIESWILQTTDGGLSWRVQYSSKALQIKRVLFINDQEGWAVGRRLVRRETLESDHFVLHTTDQGKHWVEVSGALNQLANNDNIEDIYAVRPLTAILLASSGKIFSTRDGGQRWEQVGAIQGEPPQTSMMHLGVLRGQHLWVLGGAGAREGTWAMLALKGSDDLWIKYKTAGVILNDALFLSDTQVLACGVLASDDTLPLLADEGREGVILYSPDGGRNWSIIYRNREVKSIAALSAVDASHIWAVGDDGLIIRLEPASMSGGLVRK